MLISKMVWIRQTSFQHVHVHILPRRPGDFEENNQIYQEVGLFFILILQILQIYNFYQDNSIDPSIIPHT